MRMRHNWSRGSWLSAGLAFLLLFAWGAGGGAIMLKLSLADLLAGADYVVVGTVVRTEGHWDLDRSLIYTTVTIQIDESLKGTPTGDTVAILVDGGWVEDSAQLVSTAPSFRVGEQAVLFLASLPQTRTSELRLSPSALPSAQVFEVYGHFQGKLGISDDKAGQIPLAELRIQIRRLAEKGAALPGAEGPETSPAYITQPAYVIRDDEGRELRWQPVWPNVTYFIHTSFNAEQAAAIRSSANTWNTAGARFTFTYGGTHSRSGGQVKNGVNEIVWDNLGGGATLGQARCFLESVGGGPFYIVECDTSFSTAKPFSTSTPPTSNDFESVSLHEFGHWLWLGHPPIPDAVMYYSLTTGTAKRALHSDDIAGIRAIYGVPPTEPTQPVLAVTPSSRSVGATAGTTTFSVANTGSGTMNWSASVTTGGGWLLIASGGSGTNAGTISVSYVVNTGASSRTGTITVTASGATGSPVSVNVVQAGTAPSENRPPTVSLAYRPASPTTADTVVFTASASDPDGDPLTYAWYLNGSLSTATAAEVNWSNPPQGTHTVRVVVSDGRGGTADASVTVTVRSPGGPPSDGNSHTYGGAAGWYLISVPVAAGAPSGITMWWWNASARGYVRPTTLNPQVGYWARLAASTRLSVAGSPPASDVTLNLGVAGWHMISAPWSYPKSAIRVQWRGQEGTWAEAVAAGLVRNSIYGYKATDRAYTMPTTLHPWYGYWLDAKVSGLTLRFVYASRATALGVLSDEAELVVPLWAAPADLPPPPPEEGQAPGEIRFGNTPNPIRDVHTTTFRVWGPTALGVTEITVRVYDLSGKLVWQGSVAGAELTWHTDDLAGRYLANGVYVYQITAQVAGTEVSSGFLKLSILR